MITSMRHLDIYLTTELLAFAARFHCISKTKFANKLHVLSGSFPLATFPAIHKIFIKFYLFFPSNNYQQKIYFYCIFLIVISPGNTETQYFY